MLSPRSHLELHLLLGSLDWTSVLDLLRCLCLVIVWERYNLVREEDLLNKHIDGFRLLKEFVVDP